MTQDALAATLSALQEPVELLVFKAATCPHCPLAVLAARDLAAASPEVSVRIVDVQEAEAEAKKFSISSVPTTIVDQGLAITGVVPAAEIATLVVSRGRPEYVQRHLESLVEGGRLAEATALLSNVAGQRAFAVLWNESTTASRMGLMLASEPVLERDPAGLDGVVGNLLPALKSADAALRGDTADMLGQIGHPGAREPLEGLRHDPNPDVAEIAAEAIAALRPS